MSVAVRMSTSVSRLTSTACVCSCVYVARACVPRVVPHQHRHLAIALGRLAARRTKPRDLGLQRQHLTIHTSAKSDHVAA